MSREVFDREMESFQRQFGLDATSRTYLVLAEAVRWLHHHGHGDLRLSAVDHLFGEKFRGETIFTVREIQK